MSVFKKIVFITASVYAFFLVEFILFNFFGGLGKPNLLILLVIFFNLRFGIRYGLLAAGLSGILKDSFSIHSFGIYSWAFVLGAFLTTLITRYFYEVEENFLRILTVFIISLADMLIVFAMITFFYRTTFSQVMIYIVFPEVILTTLITQFVFNTLKKCALKFSI